MVENFKVFTLVDSEKRTSSIGVHAHDVIEANSSDSFNIITYGSKLKEIDKKLQSMSKEEKEKLEKKQEQDRKEEGKSEWRHLQKDFRKTIELLVNVQLFPWTAII